PWLFSASGRRDLDLFGGWASTVAVTTDGQCCRTNARVAGGTGPIQRNVTLPIPGHSAEVHCACESDRQWIKNGVACQIQFLRRSFVCNAGEGEPSTNADFDTSQRADSLLQAEGELEGLVLRYDFIFWRNSVWRG